MEEQRGVGARLPRAVVLGEIMGWVGWEGAPSQPGTLPGMCPLIQRQERPMLALMDEDLLGF